MRELHRFQADRRRFVILDHIETRRRIGRNCVPQCPSCAAAGRDRSKDKAKCLDASGPSMAGRSNHPWERR